MCTVSLCFLDDRVVLTSNRDEKLKRGLSAVPELISLEDRKIVFSRDSQALGTWFVADSAGSVLVLLNGAFKKHVRQPEYRKSRGIILLELFKQPDVIKAFDQMLLENIEPFQLICWQYGQAVRMIWDGRSKEVIRLSTAKNHFFSSVTLYPKIKAVEREGWFTNFLGKTTCLTEDKILDFHSNSHIDDRHNGLQIDRPDGTKTLSISQAIIGVGTTNYRYIDLINKKTKQFQLIHESMEVQMEV